MLTFLQTLFSTGFVNAFIGEVNASVRHHTFIQAGIYVFVTILLTLITIFILVIVKRNVK